MPLPHLNRSSPVWLFDLDNTLHNASHAIFPTITANMNTYIARVLGDGVTPAGDAEVNTARAGYWRRYGATLLGMVRHHQVQAAHFLRETHTFDDLTAMIRAEPGLGALLKRLPGRKILLTNAPQRYSSDVMRHLGLRRHFSQHIAIEAMHVHRQLRPKPSTLMLRKLLRKHHLRPGNCILVEDTLANLKGAKKIGLRTAWVTQYLKMADPIGVARLPTALNRPAYVDVKVKSVRHLVRRLHHLR